MERFFYHGMEACYGLYSYHINIMINVLEKEGLRTRNDVREHNNEKFEHVCLYKKNEEYDYSQDNFFLKSARGAWIDHGFVYVVSPDILAEKVQYSPRTGFVGNGIITTDLVDEWRSVGPIPNTKIEGIALPFDAIKEYLNEDINSNDKEILEDKKQLIELLLKLKSLAESMGIFIVDSDEKDFTDKLDEQLNKKRKNKEC